MTNIAPQALTIDLIDEAILLAQNKTVPDWKTRIAQLDERVERIQKQIAAKPSVPPELQDAYRIEIDTLSLENMQLAGKLEQTNQALNRAKKAYLAELGQSRALKERLDELERRLLNFLNK